MFRFFENDPFFNMNHERHRNQMDDFFGFGGFGSPFMNPMLESPMEEMPRSHRDNMMRHHSDMGMENPFSFINSMMRGMHGMMLNPQQMKEEAMKSDDAICYSRSMVRSYADDGSGKPKMYEAISETKKGPGGVLESKKAVRDSESASEKMAIGRRLKDKGHVVTRERNMRTGDINENQDFLNMAEEDRDAFEADWKKKSSFFYSPQTQYMLPQSGNRRRHVQAMLDKDPSIGNDI